MATVLVIDDDPDLRVSLGSFFERAGHHVVRAQSGEEGIDAFMRVRPDLTVLDVTLPDMDGFAVLARLRADDPVVIMITGHGDMGLAVQAMRDGAENFLAKPVDLAHFAVATERALEKARLRQMNRYLRERRGGPRVGVMLGSSPAMRELADQIELLAASDRTTVLLLGESGTGKGRVAEAIHRMSPRAGAPFMDVSCAGSSAPSFEIELFGRDDLDGGAADRSARPPLLEVVNGGTLFMDEIGELDPQLQPRLLRLLESRSYRRGAGSREIPTDVRLIAATTVDLVEEVNAGRFREDLYYRLSVIPVHLPPLRARAREDLLDMIGRALDDLHGDLPGAPRELTDGALEQLLRYRWPGNLRELRNVLERAMILGRGARRIAPEHLPPEVRRASGAGVAGHVAKTLAEVERLHIEHTLRVHNLNRTRAALELGISRATLINKIRAYGLHDRAPWPAAPSGGHPVKES
ncbi:MAG: sigma-54 dependent transcriptional regulator [Gemmatimonadota bacterium]|nr:sigma-54 dependent transcriptional regulator [Gemmatimonadota bacterium]